MFFGCENLRETVIYLWVLLGSSGKSPQPQIPVPNV